MGDPNDKGLFSHLAQGLGGYPQGHYPPPHGHGSGGMGALLAGGAAAAAAAMGAHHMSHGAYGHGAYGHGAYGRGYGHHGKFKHGKFKHGKFGKHGMFGKHKVPMIQQLETMLRSGDVPQAPEFRPMPLTQPRPFMFTTVNSNADKTTTMTSTTITESRETKSGSVAEVPVKSVGDSAEVSEKLSTSNDTKSITKKSTVGAPKKKVDGVAGDPLRNVRSKIQEEIGREFAAIMASGTLRASEVVALATRKVMERYGRMSRRTELGGLREKNSQGLRIYLFYVWINYDPEELYSLPVLQKQ
ncbi:hypothetical protein IFM89_018755 [Coptis chinensis]|uniref:Uncharacterized protein n=1 Tax=Coptis chinensis TaxID=261450 RepID=A0A835LQN3_9MAGN|nr:hypothetical protein IFM89_018755 [Coptis chinensis]